MKALFIIALTYSLVGCQATLWGEGAGRLQTGTGRVGPDEIIIRPLFIMMPMGRFVLVRRGPEYCALKFTEAWFGETEEDRFAKYESYHQADGTGDFTGNDVKVTKEQLAARRLWGIIRGLSLPAGRQNREIKCGPIKLAWHAVGSVHFFPLGETEGDHGIELAPTKWTDIFQINVFDSRLKWYRYDGKRKDIYISINHLWEEGEDKE